MSDRIIEPNGPTCETERRRVEGLERERDLLATQLAGQLADVREALAAGANESATDAAHRVVEDRDHRLSDAYGVLNDLRALLRLEKGACVIEGVRRVLAERDEHRREVAVQHQHASNARHQLNFADEQLREIRGVVGAGHEEMTVIAVCRAIAEREASSKSARAEAAYHAAKSFSTNSTIHFVRAILAVADHEPLDKAARRLRAERDEAVKLLAELSKSLGCVPELVESAARRMLADSATAHALVGHRANENAALTEALEEERRVTLRLRDERNHFKERAERAWNGVEVALMKAERCTRVALKAWRENEAATTRLAALVAQMRSTHERLAEVLRAQRQQGDAVAARMAYERRAFDALLKERDRLEAERDAARDELIAAKSILDVARSWGQALQSEDCAGLARSMMDLAAALGLECVNISANRDDGISDEGPRVEVERLREQVEKMRTTIALRAKEAGEYHARVLAKGFGPLGEARATSGALTALALELDVPVL